MTPNASGSGRYSHLSPEERQKIEAYRKEGKTCRDIGELLNRSQSTISRELKRNRLSEDEGSYDAGRSQEISEKRRSEASRRGGRLSNEDLRKCVVSLLMQKWSPPRISAYLKEKTA